MPTTYSAFASCWNMRDCKSMWRRAPIRVQNRCGSEAYSFCARVRATQYGGWEFEVRTVPHFNLFFDATEPLIHLPIAASPRYLYIYSSISGVPCEKNMSALNHRTKKFAVGPWSVDGVFCLHSLSFLSAAARKPLVRSCRSSGFGQSSSRLE